MADLARLHAQYDRAAALLAQPGAAVHFVGIAGVGMAGLATLLAQRGFRVSGCDAHPDAPTVPPLRTLGVAVETGHDPAHLAALDPARGDFVVRTPAADPGSPELAAAEARGLPVLDRGAVLAALLDTLPCPLIAVCGTHGKTTTATFAAQLLRELGAAPGWCIGKPGAAAAAPGVPSPTFKVQTSSPECQGVDSSELSPFVAECDESDGSLALYHPAVTVLGSVDFDHAEHFASEAEFLGVFETVLSQTRDAIVYNADDLHLRAFVEGRSPASERGVARSAGGSTPCLLPVGTDPAARLRATHLAETPAGTSFDLSLDGDPLGRFHLPIPGHHNLLNALAAIGAIIATQGVRGASPDHLGTALAALRLPGRRFEILSTSGGIRVVADYAHHPAEIAACLAMARTTLAPGGRLIAVFQPHRPSRTLALGPQFPAAFAEADFLALAPVYAASEPDLPGGDIADLYARFRAGFRPGLRRPAQDATETQEECAQGAPPVLLRSLGEALPWLRGIARPGDTILLVGAGDIISLASSFTPGWNAAPPQPPPAEGADIASGASTAPLCSYGVGGPARALARVRTVEALRALLAWCRDTATPWRVLGAGTNFLVPDSGFDGLLLHLEGEAFAALPSAEVALPTCAAAPSRGCAQRVGAALPGARLLAEWQRLGYSGLECMDGIPGTVGGWLAMNAGAQGHAIGDCLVSLDLLDPADGTVQTLPRSALTLGYRSATRRMSSGAASARLVSHAESAETSCTASAQRESHAEFAEYAEKATASEERPLSSFVILSAVLAPRECVAPSVVAERRAAFRAKRFDFRGLRTAGSVFRNPPGDSAGRLLDAAGLKGLRVGGAFVSERHANIFCAGPDATASDLLALIRLARLRVPSLIPEVCIL